MAVRAAAFKEVGGFPDGAIDEIDDDLELTKSIYAAYGLHGLGNVRDMQVRSSMRRIRKTGYLGLGKYYLTTRSESLSNIREQIVSGNIDIR